MLPQCVFPFFALTLLSITVCAIGMTRASSTFSKRIRTSVVQPGTSASGRPSRTLTTAEQDTLSQQRVSKRQIEKQKEGAEWRKHQRTTQSHHPQYPLGDNDHGYFDADFMDNSDSGFNNPDAITEELDALLEMCNGIEREKKKKKGPNNSEWARRMQEEEAVWAPQISALADSYLQWQQTVSSDHAADGSVPDAHALKMPAWLLFCWPKFAVGCRMHAERAFPERAPVGVALGVREVVAAPKQCVRRVCSRIVTIRSA
ncbi:hypothetical protein BOTBODRAFT_49788 [Botryobasidium botryosum FD-172 SS1]|uniref:Uncharacterized protein n=1 Tax=Botryobasidium botryosum (strain FD-172 SS1) TaxID=930990 RepID=A0A067LRF8_BOTB1|nr:hypothetical protein BOTBODRAFT_49788 [Botryobasidium botryosum FD-172 SS1]